MTGKQFKSMLIIVLAIFSMVSFMGCGRGGVSSTQVSGSGSSGEYKLPLCEPGSVELSFLTYQNWDSSAYYDSTAGLPVENEIERITGVKIRWECVSSDDYVSVAQTRLAAGVNLPDMIQIPQKSIGLARYQAEGLLVNMSKYISEKKTPFVWKLFQEQPIYKAYSTSPDGNIYGFPYCEYGVNNVVVQWNSIRADWLKKLGLQMPQTIDEYYKVLVAFRDQDPNGNGLKDEWPLIYQNDEMFGLYRYKNAFGFETTDMWSMDRNGNVQLDLVDDKFLDCLTTLNQWYRERLLYPEVRSSATWDVITQDKAGGVTVLSSDNLLTRNASVHGVNPDCNYVFIPLLTNTKYPDNKPNLSKRGSWHNYFSITADCKNPEIAVQWLDWVWASPESVVLRYWGFEDKTYKTENGKMAYLDNVTRSPLGSIGYLRGIGAYPNFVANESGESFLAMYVDQYPEQAYKDFSPHFVDIVPEAIGTQEENDTYTTTWPDLETYIKESVVGFITGTKPLSEWRNYVDTCNRMGLQRVVEIRQAWANRFR